MAGKPVGSPVGSPVGAPIGSPGDLPWLGGSTGLKPIGAWTGPEDCGIVQLTDDSGNVLTDSFGNILIVG